MAAHVKNKILKFDLHEIEDAFFEDTTAFGIKALEEPYHIAWLINQMVGTKFIRNKENLIELNDNFVLYEFNDKRNYLNNYLYTNKRNGQILVKSLKGFSFIWLIQGQDTNRFFYVNEVLKKIKAIGKEGWLQRIDLDNCTDKSLLIF
jgi:hypothetical protein